MSNVVELQIRIDDCVVHIYFERGAYEKLNENRHSFNIGQYRVDVDSPHTADGYKHVHVSYKDDALFALNSNGTGHDSSKGSGYRIPNKVADGLRDKCKWLKIPDNGIIECIDFDVAYYKMILEADRFIDS